MEMINFPRKPRPKYLQRGFLYNFGVGRDPPQNRPASVTPRRILRATSTPYNPRAKIYFLLGLIIEIVLDTMAE